MAVPPWFVKMFYTVFVPFCIIGAIYIGHSMIVQSRLTTAVDTMEGDVGVDPDTALQQSAVADLATRPVFAFQYLNQSLLQDEDTDPRMARALALNKALEWGTISERRKIISDILAVMGESGDVPRDALRQDWDGRDGLREMIDYRRGLSNPTPAEQRITDVLMWVYEGRPTPPQGPEKRRIQALEKAYQKKSFARVEGGALEALMKEWTAGQGVEGANAQVAARAAEAFGKMLAGEAVELDSEAAEFVRARSHEYELAYEEGMSRVARAARTMVNLFEATGNAKYLGWTPAADETPEERMFVDHPHVYQYVSLLGYRKDPKRPDRFKEVRELVADGVFAMRHRKFVLYFLREFSRKTAINPVMAVETERLTKEEHEREMRQINDERVVQSQRLMERIFVDYLANKGDYQFKDLDTEEERDEYVRAKLVHAMQDLVEDLKFGATAREHLRAMREAAAAAGQEDYYFRTTVQ